LRSGSRSIVAAAFQVGTHLRPRLLVHREAMARRRSERGARPLRDLECVLGHPAAPFEIRERRIEIRHAVDRDRPLSVEVIGEEDEWTLLVETEGCHTSPVRLDREDDERAQTLERLHVRGDVLARRVEEVEALERRIALVRHGLQARRVPPSSTVAHASIAHVPIPKAVARFNRSVTNPIARLVAGWVPPFVLVEHVGRMSGRTYRTPVWAFARDRRLVVALTYGSATDWARNVLASGGATVARLGRRQRYADARIVHGADGMDLMPGVVRPALRAFGVDEFLVLRPMGPS
jgi:deazaflavin-dependent oxidoreductase (nitroreductase family)